MPKSSKPPAEDLDPEPPLADWLVALSHGSPFESRQAAAVWGRDAPRLALVPILISLLKDPDRDVRLRVVTALGHLAGQVRQFLPALHAALKDAALHDGDESVRTQAVHAVLEGGPQPASEVAALVDALRDELDVVRFHAVMVLGNVGPEARPAVPALIHAALRDGDPAVRVGAAMALWKIEGKEPLVVPALVKALEDANELVCW